MSAPSSNRKRRQLCLALPVAALAAVAGSAAQARTLFPAGIGHTNHHTGFEVALKLDMFGEVSKPVVVAQNAERITLRGVHGDTPWALEFTIARMDYQGNLRVQARLTGDGEVLAAPIRTAVIGQRVVVRADDQINVAMLVRRV
ncbi:hypothetical protein FVD38_24640 [Massilia arenae]|uniref:DUF5666 domain-containing protein n=1 Tax=Massilia arenae TaxID=2603288 RepID=A0A5C7FPY1_9BURK|nr:hypothetical protein FVD38_24640 [Massilia arenae]